MQPEQIVPGQPQPVAQPHNPGKTLGIVGFIFAFVGLHLVGLILSIIALVKSHGAGMRNGLAVAGIVLNATFMVVVVPLLAITIVAYGGITAKANSNKAAANASTVQRYAEAFNADQGRYPDSLSDFALRTGSSVLPSYINIIGTNGGITLNLNATTGEENIWYQYTGTSGAATGGRISYWDFKNQKISDTVLYVGTGSAASDEFHDVNK